MVKILPLHFVRHLSVMAVSAPKTLLNLAAGARGQKRSDVAGSFLDINPAVRRQRGHRALFRSPLAVNGEMMVPAMRTDSGANLETHFLKTHFPPRASPATVAPHLRTEGPSWAAQLAADREAEQQP